MRTVRRTVFAALMGVGAIAAMAVQGSTPVPAEAQTPQGAAMAKATVAAGCFWCVEADFDKLPGVVSTTSGYAGGPEKNPTYEQVSSGRTGHTEAVEVVYDPAKVTYEQILDYFWHHVDPFTADRQCCDAGSQYRPAIFYHDADQKRLAEASKARVEAHFKRPVAVQIVAATAFYKAEAYHQDFYKKDPVRYYSYRAGCGRDRRVQQIWGSTESK